MRSTIMVRVSFVLVAVVVALLEVAAPATAYEGYYRKGTFVMAGGFNNPVGETAPYLNSSGSIFFAGGANVRRNFTLQVEYTHHWLAIAPEVIDRATSDSTQVEDAHASLWSVTLNGLYKFDRGSDIVPWLTAGAGYYKRNVQLTQTAWVYWPPVWDPWWGWIDGGWAPGEAIVGQHSSSGFGFNVGLGVDIKIESGASLFVETRYHHAFLDGVDMQIVPIMAGVRW